MLEERTILRIVLLAAIAGLGGGFLWGLADHRGPEAVTRFAESHIAFDDKRDGALVFTCTKGERPLVLYDLRTDTIWTGPKEIERWETDPVNNVLESAFVSHAMAAAVGGYSVFFSLDRELEIFSKSKEGLFKNRRVLLAVSVLIPTAALGYLASDLFHLECTSHSVHERLIEKKYWAAPRRKAAKQIFNEFGFCFDRFETLSTTEGALAQRLTDSGTRLRDQGLIHRVHRAQAIRAWRQYISSANTKLPNQDLVARRFSTDLFLSYNRKNLLDSKERRSDIHLAPTWADSIYQRINEGANGLVLEVDLDGADFTLLLAARDRCAARLDFAQAKNLFEETQLRNILDVGVTESFQEDFARRVPRL
jgi:hypothetical protein